MQLNRNKNKFPHTLSHSPFHTSPLPTHLSLPPPTPQHTSLHLPLHPNTLSHSPHALSHIFPHSFDYVAKLPCDDVTGTLINLTEKAR